MPAFTDERLTLGFFWPTSQIRELSSRQSENIWPEKHQWAPAHSKHALLGAVCQVFVRLACKTVQ